MSTYERIQELAKNQGMSVRELGRKLDIGDTTIYKWRTQTPKIDVLEKVADYFGVTLDYLTGRENKNTIPTDDDLDDMIDHARSFDGKPVTDHDREIIKAYLKGLYANKN
ncbi:helix-turn-helix domain-containing protein [Ligilactobacillus saerimneri]|uniref:Helix-turn-helix domain-containing protein n=1 Tax=Ligilactobacillus saerimneri TaxID=228229 RepID=A0A7H9EKA5_9LACO|nr:helix-turn-helix transcriptional regulator [Ligilactobacillus saerimneri]QLL77605.1 helix-turn-helix domain-containing protein [Ligilactobacillus saerimneri]